MHFKNRVIWITGASSGIGCELALQLAAQGAKLVLTARNEKALQEVAGRCGVLSFILAADLSVPQQIPELVRKAIEAFGTIDAVIHAAGVSQRSLAEATHSSVYRKLMEINFFAPVEISRLLLPHFRANGGGHLVAISSVAGLLGFPLRTGYAASKHALKGWFEALQTEHTIPGLAITIVYPGRIRTPISVAALTGDGTSHNRMDEGQLKGIPVEDCARKIIQAMTTRKRRILIARGERILWWLWFFVPALYYRIARKKGA